MEIFAQDESAQSQTLYRFYSPDGVLLYIGITGDAGARWHDHAKLKGWWREVSTVRVEHFDTREEVEAAESAAIIAERPLHNIVYNSDSRRRATLVIEPPSDPEHFSGACWACGYSGIGKHRGHLPIAMDWLDGNLTTRHLCPNGHEWKEVWGDAIYRVAICKCSWCLNPRHAGLEVACPT